MGILLGLRQCDPGSALPQDAEATRRRLRGEAFNPGCGPLPPDWQEIGWIRITAADFPALVAFYRDVLTIPLVESTEDRALFDIGDNTLLELAPGGVSRPAPPNSCAAGASISCMMSSLRPGGISPISRTPKAT
jgi:hypothetical protein